MTMAGDPDRDRADDELPVTDDEAPPLVDVEDGVSVAPEVELLNDVTQHYLNEMGAKPLFTAHEEYSWACRARRRVCCAAKNDRA